MITLVILGATLAEGSRSTVHACGEDAVAKAPRPSTPEGWIELEARFAAIVREIGAPVPALLDLTTVAGRTVSIYARARGPTMWQHLLDHPADVGAMAGLLIELQTSFHSLAGPVELPRLTDRVSCKVRLATAAGGPLAGVDAPTVLAAVPPITTLRLCHGDLHPGNVVLTPDGPLVVDWFDVSRGEPLADLARSRLLIDPDPAGGLPAHLPGATRALVQDLAVAYRCAIDDRIGPDPGLIERWVAVLAVARIAEGVPPEGLARRWHDWHRTHRT